MDQPDDVVFYLDRGLLQSAREGRHNFIGLVSKALVDAGLRVYFEQNSGAARKTSAERPGFSLFHMDDPSHPRALTMRRNYFYPFWQIERSARRWEWDVALSRFKGEEVDRPAAEQFTRFWRRRLFSQNGTQDTPTGPVLIPLQGLIREHRSFQSCSPVEMIHRTVTRFSDRDVLVTLHPNETYSSNDRDILAGIQAKYPNVTVATRPADKILPVCSAVVTQNSSVALQGFFFRKPAVVFAQIDFHHIAGNVPMKGEDTAFAALKQDADFDGYLWWFLQQNSINAGRPEALDKISDTLRHHGWPV